VYTIGIKTRPANGLVNASAIVVHVGPAVTAAERTLTRDGQPAITVTGELLFPTQDVVNGIPNPGVDPQVSLTAADGSSTPCPPVAKSGMWQQSRTNSRAEVTIPVGLNAGSYRVTVPNQDASAGEVLLQVG
jgi:hypothetical protein